VREEEEEEKEKKIKNLHLRTAIQPQLGGQAMNYRMDGTISSLPLPLFLPLVLMWEWSIGIGLGFVAERRCGIFFFGILCDFSLCMV